MWMTYEEAISMLDPGAKMPNFPHTAEEVDEACRIAVSAIRAQQERENPKPLTIDELFQMDGDPVWVVYDEDAGTWALVEVLEESVFLTNKLGGRSEYAADVEFEEDGIAVYRRKPEPPSTN